MTLVLGTNDGVWRIEEANEPTLLGLGGKRIAHLAVRDGTVLAAIGGDGLYELGGSVACVWDGDAHSCAITPDGSWYAGAEPAMIFRSRDRGATWERLSAIDDLPTRGEWTFPPPPHEPHVLSIEALPGKPGTVIAGIEVGGVILSENGGDTWREMNNGIYVDVHSVRAHPSDSSRLFAVTGNGFYASEDGGKSWERRMVGIGHGYTIGLAVSAEGRLIVTVTDGPMGGNGRTLESEDGGRRWRPIEAESLPSGTRRASVPFFHDSVPWLGSGDGRLFRGDGSWRHVATLPAPINVIASLGYTSSVMH